MIYTFKNKKYNLKTGKISEINHKSKKKLNKKTWTIFVSECHGKDYNFFLNSRYWKKIKQIILKRDNYKCTVCGSHKNLNIHHTTYKNHLNEHNHLGDLLTVCFGCHNEFHKIKEVI